MSSEVVADENVHSGIINILRGAGFSVFSVSEAYSGIGDRQVIQLAREKSALLITEDSDFGELVFSHGIQTLGIIFLRYDFRDWKEIGSSLCRVLQEGAARFQGKFTVMNKDRIRFRELP